MCRQWGSRIYKDCCRRAALHSAAGSWRTSPRCFQGTLPLQFLPGLWNTLAQIRSSSSFENIVAAVATLRSVEPANAQTSGPALGCCIARQAEKHLVLDSPHRRSCLALHSNLVSISAPEQRVLHNDTLASIPSSMQSCWQPHRMWPLAVEVFAWCPVHGEHANHHSSM